MAAIGISNIIPTPFFPKVNEGEPLKQVARLTLTNTGDEIVCKVLISIDGEKSYLEDIGLVNKGESVHDIHLLDIQRTKNIALTVLNNGKVLAEKRVGWQPQKKWMIYYAAVSHQDLGFETYFQNIRRAVREAGIDQALEFCQQTDTWEDDAKFRWNIETSEPLSRWINKQTPEKVDELIRRIKEGRIELGAIHNTISSQMAGYETLARSFYTPNRYVVDMLGIEPAKVAIINDVTGITRSWPLFMKEAQIPYFMHGSNSPNCLNDLIDIPVFYWISPDNDHQNKTLCRTDSYYSPNKIGKWNREGVDELINRNEKLKWPYDCILAYDSEDFAIPSLDNATNIRNWNRFYEYPRIRCSTINSFFDDVNKQADKSKILETSKDAPDSWDDQDGSDAALLAEARKTNNEIPTAEKFAAIAMSLGRGYPEKLIFQAYNSLIMYHEHTNGAVNGGDHQYYETERRMHQALVKESTDFCTKALKESLKQINDQIKTDSNALVIYNPLSWQRDEMVFINPSDIPVKYFALYDCKTNKQVKIQRLRNGKIAFFAEAVPSLGYKTYRYKETTEPVVEVSHLTKESVCENQFFKIAMDQDKNTIPGIIDKQLDINLIDKNSPYSLGEYIHYDHYSKEWKKTKFTGITCYKGPVVDEIHINQECFSTDKIELTIYAYHNLKKIDFSLEINKLSNYEDLVGSWNRDFKEAIFCAFPFYVPDFQFHHELAGAILQPGNKDLQFEASESAYYAIQHFADVSNSKFGVTLSTIECPLVEYGYPRPGYWDNTAKKPKEDIVNPKNSSMFLYLMNNFFPTNIAVDQPGLKKFTFAIQSHSGDWKEGESYRFGWESSHPLIPEFIHPNPDGILPQMKSFLTVDAKNVICSTIKPAEANGSGYILRFFELEGKDTRATVKINLIDTISKGYATSLIENDLKEIPVTGANEITFDIKGHGLKTIRVVGVTDKMKAVEELKAHSLSDAQIRLEWAPIKHQKISHYAIYRSQLPDCRKVHRNFIGTSQMTSYLDGPELNYGGWPNNNLDPDKTYYYRICPVDLFNNEGPETEIVSCKTLPTSILNAVPRKVEGLYTVYVSPLAPENYINLWFYTNVEKDVDKYLIYRGETPYFTPDSSNLLNSLIPSEGVLKYRGSYSYSELDRQMYRDTTAKVNKKYYYKVCAVDNAGQKGEYSDPAEAIMRVNPIHIKTNQAVLHDFVNFIGDLTVTIETSISDAILHFTTDNSEPTIESPKYSVPFELRHDAVVNVAIYKKGEDKASFRRSKLIKVPKAIAQSSYGSQYNPGMAIDGSDDPGSSWISLPYGGLSKDSPADVWLGIILPQNTRIKGISLIGDNRKEIPFLENFKIYTRLNGKMSLSGEFKDGGIKMTPKNSFKIVFANEVNTDGILFCVNGADLPKSDNIEQDGIVRVCEVLLIMPDGSEKNVGDLK